MTLKGRDKFRNFPKKMYKFFCGWSANRDKICQVVRESENFENRWYKKHTLTLRRKMDFPADEPLLSDERMSI